MLVTARTSTRWSVPVSVGLQLAAITLLVMLPLIYGERLPFLPLERAVVYLPPVRHTPPPPAQTTGRQTRAVPRFHGNVLTDPLRIPPHPVIINDAAPPIPGSELLAGGPSVGVPYGISTSDLLPKNIPAPPPPAPKPIEVHKPLRVSSGVQEAKRINYVLPQYPALARTARISGTVQLIGVIGTDGTIQSLRVISGHPLLAKAAMDAVSQWRYRPTLLSGQPVEVIAPITVTFALSR